MAARDHSRAQWSAAALGAAGLLLAHEAASLSFSLGLFSAYTVFVVLTSNHDRNFLHPLVAFPLFYYPYATWHAFSSILTRTNELIYLTATIHHTYLGLLVFHVVGIACLRLMKTSPPSFRDSALRTPLSDKLVLWACLLVAVVFLRNIMVMDYTTKRSILDSQTASLAIINVTMWIMTSTGLLVLVRWWFGRIKLDVMVIISLVLALAVYLVVGERDYLLRMGLCMLFLFFDRKRVARLPVLLAILLVAAFLVPWSQMYKAVWFADSSQSLSESGIQLFSGEFYSASRNLYVLLSRGYDSSWRFLASNVFRGVVPFSSGLGVLSSVAWFHHVYRYEEGIEGTSGWGFHIVADGCLAGGLAGIMLIMACLAIFLCWFYHRRYRSEYGYLFYLMSLSSAIYCIRADLANLLSLVVKVGGSVVVFLYLLDRVLTTGKRRPRTRPRMVSPDGKSGHA